jgi:hypothetical protein
MTTMKLPNVVQTFLDDMGWDDEITIDESAGLSQLKTGVSINDQPYTLVIETDEQRSWIVLFLYNLSSNVPEKRMSEACHLVNAINNRVQMGKIMVTKAAGPFRFVHAVDLEGVEASGIVVQNMYSAGVGVFTVWADALSAVALTKTSAEEILKEIDQQAESADGQMPDAL